MTRPPESSIDIDANTHARKNIQMIVPGGKRRPLRPSISTSMMIPKNGHIRSPEPMTHQSRYIE
jgi:hypothetical protein